MEKESPVQAVSRLFRECFKDASPEWQIEVGEGMTLEEFLRSTSITLPAVFITYGSFVEDPEFTLGSKVLRYEETMVMYLLADGDKYPTARRFTKYVHEPGVRREQFRDTEGEKRELKIQSGDGIRLQAEGIPAFEIQIKVL